LADYWQKTVDKTVEKWRFAEVDVSSARNNFGGFLNTPNFPNWSAFVALKADGSIKAWGYSSSLYGLPHAVIEPSALRAAKALSVE
jgi:hypothetical protein